MIPNECKCDVKRLEDLNKNIHKHDITMWFEKIVKR